MSYELNKLARVRYYIEPEGSYATNGSGSVTYRDMIVLEDGTFELNKIMLDNNTVAQRVDDKLIQVVSGTQKRCNATFSSYLMGTGTSAGKGTLSITSSLGDFLKAIMGGEHRTTGSGVQTANTAGEFVVNGQANDLLYPGTIIGIQNTTTNFVETSQVAAYNTTTNALTCSHNFGFTPASGSTVYGASTYYLTQNPATSMQLYVQGAETDDTWVLCGLQGGFGLKTELGQLPTIDFKLENGATWFTGSTDDLSVASYVNSVPPVFTDGFVSFFPLDGTYPEAQSTLTALTSIEITPAIAYTDVMSPGGVGNILRKRRNRAVPVVTGKFTIAFEDKSYYTARDNATLYGLKVQIGNFPGNTVVISMPRVQITNVQRVGAGDIAGQEISFACYENSLVTAASGQTDLARSAMVIGLL